MISLGPALIAGVLGMRQVNEARSAREQQQTALDKQATAAKEAASLRPTKEAVGADVVIGTTNAPEVTKKIARPVRKTASVGTSLLGPATRGVKL